MMEYKGYTAKVDVDTEAGILHGEVLHLRDVITFQGTTVDELREDFKAAIDDYLEWCAELGEEPEKPYSGRFNIRLDPELHRDLVTAAALDKKSLNTWVTDALKLAVTQRKTAAHPKVGHAQQNAVEVVAYGHTIYGGALHAAVLGEFAGLGVGKKERVQASSFRVAGARIASFKVGQSTRSLAVERKSDEALVNA